MTIMADVMTPDLNIIAPDADLRAAAEMMRDLDVGALPVFDGKQLTRMITDRDIPVLRRARMELVGVFSLGDLATRQEGSTDSTLEAVSSPLPPTRQSTGKQPDSR